MNFRPQFRGQALIRIFFGPKLKLMKIDSRSLAILSVALIGVFVAMWMLIYVVIKMCDKTLGGSQTLGLILLFSVVLLFCSVIPWLLPPNEMICATRHFLPPLALGPILQSSISAENFFRLIFILKIVHVSAQKQQI
jgi:hypothetical protein